MSEYDELLRGLRERNASSTYEQMLREKAAQAIERLERELANTQAAYKKACDIAAEAKTGRTPAVQRLQKHSQELTNLLCEKEREIAEARAREDDRQEAIRAVLKVLPTQREPHPDDDLQKLVNLACSLLDDALTDYVPEALAAPAPGTGGAERPTLTRPQREILHHTKWRAAGRMYCGARDDADIQSLIRLGYMRDCGTPGHLPDDDAYFTITETGLKALAAQQQESGE